MNPFNNCSFVGRIPNHEAFKINYFEGNESNGKRSRYSTVLAVKRDRKKPEDKYYKDDLIPITAWGTTADYLNKWVQRGSMIAITGTLNVETVSSDDGTRHTYYNVIVDSVRTISSSSANSDNSEQPQQQSSFPAQQQVSPAPPPSEYQNSGFNPFAKKDKFQQ